MTYKKLTFLLNESQFFKVDSALTRLGALSITAEDAKDKPILEPQPGETPLWDELIVTALFHPNKNEAKVAGKLTPLLTETQQASMVWTEVSDQAWERAWLKYYEPICFGNRLWVGSAEHTPPAEVKASLFLDPGLAFGTGSHPTTYLCLEALSEIDLTGKTLIDYGCGSGILMLAALKLGAKHVWGTDIDPQALEATLENARRNHIDKKCFDLALPSGRAPVDLLVANILMLPLIELAAVLVHLVKQGGSLILSGLLAEQANIVKAAYTDKVTWLETKEKDGWICLVGCII